MEHFPKDKRRQRRIEAAITVQVRGFDVAGHPYDASTTAVQVSRRGLSFLTRHELAISAPLTVVIPGRGPVRPGEGPTDFFAEAIVLRTAKDDGDFYRVNVRFVGATLPMYSAERF